MWHHAGILMEVLVIQRRKKKLKEDSDLELVFQGLAGAEDALCWCQADPVPPAPLSTNAKGPLLKISYCLFGAHSLTLFCNKWESNFISKGIILSISVPGLMLLYLSSLFSTSFK